MPAPKAPRAKAAHLMCGVPFWGFAAFLGCAYLTYVSVVHVRQGEFAWAHDGWTIASHGVWVLLMAGLINETRCRRERILFGLVLANFLLGFALAAWSGAPESAVRQVRLASSGLWGLATVMSLVVMYSSRRTSSGQNQS